MNPARLLVDPSSPMLVYLSTPVDRPVISPSLSPLLSWFPKYRRLYLLRWIHILAPQLATHGWTRISARWLYLGPVGERTATGWGGGREQNRNAGVRGTKRGRKLADESRSGSTWGKVVVRDQPSATAAIVRLFLSSPSFYFLLAPFLFSSLALALFPFPLPWLDPSNHPPTPDFLHVSSRLTFTFGETRDVARGRWLPSQPPRRSSWPETSRRNLKKAMVSSLGGYSPRELFPDSS